jgi:hypothetical protein
MKQVVRISASVGRSKPIGHKPALILMALLLFTPALSGQQQSEYPTLDPQFEPLRAQFNRDNGKVHLLILLDPT